MNERGKTVDKTFLSLDNAEKRGFIHRDYIAHCFRWTHAAKHIQRRWREATILDVGCGKEMPFPKLIYTSKLRPLQYVGLDVDETPMPEMLQKVTFPCERLIGDVAEAESYKDLGFKKQPNFITMFEVFEHVELEHGIRCLRAIHNCMAHDGLFMLSTPVYNIKDVAANHVSEITYAALGAVLEDSGFAIEAGYGTFASQSELKEVMDDATRSIFESLRCYYDSNVLSVIFAPLYPEHSRNVIWDCRKATKKYERQFPTLEETEKPWTSSSNEGL